MRRLAGPCRQQAWVGLLGLLIACSQGHGMGFIAHAWDKLEIITHRVPSSFMAPHQMLLATLPLAQSEFEGSGSPSLPNNTST